MLGERGREDLLGEREERIGLKVESNSTLELTICFGDRGTSNNPPPLPNIAETDSRGRPLTAAEVSADSVSKRPKDSDKQWDPKEKERNKKEIMK